MSTEHAILHVRLGTVNKVALHGETEGEYEAYRLDSRREARGNGYYYSRICAGNCTTAIQLETPAAAS